MNPEFDKPRKLAALLHDAPEYVIGDLISPFKAAIGLDYKAFEMRLLAAIHQRYGLTFADEPGLAAAIKHADRVAAYYEATVLAGFARAEAERFFGRPELPRGLADELELLEPLNAEMAGRQFVARFTDLFKN